MIKKPDADHSRTEPKHHEIRDAKEVAVKRAEDMIKQSAQGTSPSEKPSGDEHEKLKQQLEELLRHKDRWLRQAADFENAKKRIQKEKDDFAKFANAGLISGFIPILRNLDRAVHHGQKQNQSNDPLVVGVELVLKQFEKFLGANGVKRIESVGKVFDPYLHEAVNHIPSDNPAGTVIEETEPGYLMYDRLIIPAKVVVSSGPVNAPRPPESGLEKTETGS